MTTTGPAAPLDPFSRTPTAATLAARREAVFLLLAGVFLGSLTMLNILGIARFWQIAAWVPGEGLRWGAFPAETPATWTLFQVAIGVLPYPVTFLCTDLIGEFYGRRRAAWVVMVGLLLNGWVLLVMWLGGVVPGGGPAEGAFLEIRSLTFAIVAASMVAYLLAQTTDVYLFHFWKRRTAGRKLWLRNNASTLVSQLVDTTAVIGFTFLTTSALPIDPAASALPQVALLIGTEYVLKAAAAVADTPFFYAAHAGMRRWLGAEPAGE